MRLGAATRQRQWIGTTQDEHFQYGTCSKCLGMMVNARFGRLANQRAPFGNAAIDLHAALELLAFLGAEFLHHSRAPGRLLEFI